MASATTRNLFDKASLSAQWTREPLQHVGSLKLGPSAGGKSYPDSLATIRLAQAEHEVLIELSRRYTNLRSNLIALGADPEVIERFSNENVSPDLGANGGTEKSSPIRDEYKLPTEQKNNGKWTVPNVACPQKHLPASDSQKKMSARADIFYPSGEQSCASDWTDDFDEEAGRRTDSSADETSPLSQTPPNVELDGECVPRNSIARHAQRSLRLDNLSIGTQVADIVAELRGGQILEIYQRYKEKAAIVSFVHENEAQAFYDHVRKHDLYVKSKRVEVSWNDFQKQVPGQLAWSIRNGASRNFIVRQCDSYQTTEGIRDDVEHIHDLRVVSVEFRGRDCYIKTNSIQGAVFARTCMSSRHRYKRCRMEWDIDECVEPLDVVPEKSYAAPKPLPKPARPVNRYEMLSVDRDA